MRNLEDKQNKLRFNNFAYAMRELARHVLKRLAPDDKVLKCAWYKTRSPRKTMESLASNKLSMPPKEAYPTTMFKAPRT
ncbi:hypothetical protein [Pseudomonas chlororaphis]|uniref:pPIWI-associating nuclease domain-containing protein n=1 Tax=Pseudomonas chlororaphis TaxID=587753 RepID=UPI0039E10608